MANDYRVVKRAKCSNADSTVVDVPGGRFRDSLEGTDKPCGGPYCVVISRSFAVLGGCAARGPIIKLNCIVFTDTCCARVVYRMKYRARIISLLYPDKTRTD